MTTGATDRPQGRGGSIQPGQGESLWRLNEDCRGSECVSYEDSALFIREARRTGPGSAC